MLHFRVMRLTDFVLLYVGYTLALGLLTALAVSAVSAIRHRRLQ